MTFLMMMKDLYPKYLTCLETLHIVFNLPCKLLRGLVHPLIYQNHTQLKRRLDDREKKIGY